MIGEHLYHPHHTLLGGGYSFWSFYSGAYQKISLDVRDVGRNPIEGFHCTIRQGSRTWQRTSSSAMEIPKSSEVLIVTCSKDGKKGITRLASAWKKGSGFSYPLCIPIRIGGGERVQIFTGKGTLTDYIGAYLLGCR